MKFWKTPLLAAGLAFAATHASAEILFQDTFDRANSTDLNASDVGQSGSLSPLDWAEGVAISGSVTINSNQLKINQSGTPNSNGDGGGYAYVDNNFIGLTQLKVTMDITQQTSGGNGRFVGFALGQTEADITGLTSVAPGDNNADLSVYLDNVGGSTGIVVVEDTNTTFAGSGLGELSAVLSFADQNAGTTVNYEVFFQGSSVTTGDFTWSGTNQNFIYFSSNSTGDTLINTITIENVPEPGSLALLGLGGLCMLKRRRP